MNRWGANVGGYQGGNTPGGYQGGHIRGGFQGARTSNGNQGSPGGGFKGKVFVNYTCKQCKNNDHRTKFCPVLYNPDGSSTGVICCHFCGEKHKMEVCPKLRNRRCRICTESGHSASHCPKRGSFPNQLSGNGQRWGSQGRG